MARYVMNIAHRGGAALWPENTLAAFEGALTAGSDGLEIDVQLTKDDVAVIHHNYRLNPDFSRDSRGTWLSGRQPRLSSMTHEALAAVRIGMPRPGSDYATAHPGIKPVETHVPSLDEGLEVFRSHGHPDSVVLLELKHPTRERQVRTDSETLISRAVTAVDAAGVGERAIFVGFNWNVMRAVKRRRPDSRLWFTTYPESWFRPGATPHRPPSERKLSELRQLYAAGAPWMGPFWPGRFDGSIPRAVKAAAADGWLVYGPDAADDDVRLAQSLDLDVGVWGTDEAAELQRFLDLGVTAICTDRPDRLAELQGRPWEAAARHDTALKA